MFPQKPHSGSRRIEVDFTDILARVEEAGQPDTSELSRRERPPLQKLDRAGSVRLARIGWSGWSLLEIPRCRHR